MGYKIYLNITCLKRRCYWKYWRRSSLKRKTSRILQINVFEMPDNKNIGKLFPKYELLFLDQANSSSDPSQIFILRFLIPRAPLPLCKNFTLAYWNPSSTQSWSCSSSVSLFCLTPFNHMTPEVLDIPNNTAS